MKRRFIGIEQLTYDDNDSLRRLQHVINGDQSGISKDNDINWKGGGSFIYAELKSINEHLISCLLKTQTDKEVNEFFEEAFHKGFVSYRVKEISFDLLQKEFASLPLLEKKNFIKEMLDKNYLYLPYSEIEDATYAIDHHTRKLNQIFYNHVPPGKIQPSQ